MSKITLECQKFQKLGKAETMGDIQRPHSIQEVSKQRKRVIRRKERNARLKDGGEERCCLLS